MTRTLVRSLIATLFSLAIFLVVFVLVYLALLLIVGSLAISYFSSLDPNWDSGPGGIVFLPVFVIIIPFSICLTVLAWKRISRLLSKRYEQFRQGNGAGNLILIFLAIGILGIGVPFFKGLLSGYLYNKGYVG
jgi:hypothetical protein